MVTSAPDCVSVHSGKFLVGTVGSRLCVALTLGDVAQRLVCFLIGIPLVRARGARMEHRFVLKPPLFVPSLKNKS